jgi:hypothetical protein
VCFNGEGTLSPFAITIVTRRRQIMKSTIQSKELPERRRVETEDHPDGKRVVRHYQDGTIVSEAHFETLTTGKNIHREFDGRNHLKRESHFYGSLDIALNSDFSNGKKTGEEYFVKRRLATRRSYERARLKYNDMPTADASFEDFGAHLLSLVAAERKASVAARKSHIPNQENAEKTDKFCRQLIANGSCADARIWIKDPNHTLGEMDHKASRRLVERLTRAGASRIFVCEIEDYGERGQNTGHLVVELCKTRTLRRKLFESLARLAQEEGFAGDPDDGQDYAYVKLD